MFANDSFRCILKFHDYNLFMFLNFIYSIFRNNTTVTAYHSELDYTRYTNKPNPHASGSQLGNRKQKHDALFVTASWLIGFKIDVYTRRHSLRIYMDSIRRFCLSVSSNDYSIVASVLLFFKFNL